MAIEVRLFECLSPYTATLLLDLRSIDISGAQENTTY